jgi:hypothetical protein
MCLINYTLRREDILGSEGIAPPLFASAQDKAGREILE